MYMGILMWNVQVLDASGIRLDCTWLLTADTLSGKHMACGLASLVYCCFYALRTCVVNLLDLQLMACPVLMLTWTHPVTQLSYLHQLIEILDKTFTHIACTAAHGSGM